MPINRIEALVLKRKRFIFEASLVLSVIAPTLFSIFFIPLFSPAFYFNTFFSSASLLLLLYNRTTRYTHLLRTAQLFVFLAYIHFTATVILNVEDTFAGVWYLFLVLMVFLVLENRAGFFYSALVVATLILIEQLGLIPTLSPNLVSVLIAVVIITTLGTFINNTIRANEAILNDENRLLESRVQERTQELDHTLTHENVTGLPNRHALLRYLDRHEAVALAIIDIRHFSHINDTFSHDTGDAILREVARRLGAYVSQGMTLFRLDSDRFALVYTQWDAQNHKTALEKLQADFEANPIDIEMAGVTQAFGVSLLIAMSFEPKGLLLDTAGLVLKHAKRTHQNFVVYDKAYDLEGKTIRAMNNLKLIKRAIDEDDIVPVFQKILHQEHNYYEALVRLRRGAELLSPALFLDDAKKTPYYHQITRIMIEKSMDYFRTSNAKFSINLSFQDIAHPEMEHFIIDRLKHFSQPQNVVFEMLESENIEVPTIITRFNARIKEYGASLAIDDFGSGYSNFHYLADLEPDILKIDGSIIKHIAIDTRYALIAKTIVQFAHDQHMMVVGEFVHNQATFDTAQSLGIDAFQGYHIAKPELEVER
ncbi:MAG: hypothetical protein KU37_07100 [Sulfuricurvum sp. PC08-66]|nr:MAG: hypothetical protein KU37_07100 [Sulfuricurvum sp. PC08-66]